MQYCLYNAANIQWSNAMNDWRIYIMQHICHSVQLLHKVAGAWISWSAFLSTMLFCNWLMTIKFYMILRMLLIVLGQKSLNWFVALLYRSILNWCKDPIMKIFFNFYVWTEPKLTVSSYALNSQNCKCKIPLSSTMNSLLKGLNNGTLKKRMQIHELGSSLSEWVCTQCVVVWSAAFPHVSDEKSCIMHCTPGLVKHENAELVRKLYSSCERGSVVIHSVHIARLMVRSSNHKMQWGTSLKHASWPIDNVSCCIVLCLILWQIASTLNPHGNESHLVEMILFWIYQRSRNALYHWTCLVWNFRPGTPADNKWIVPKSVEQESAY